MMHCYKTWPGRVGRNSSKTLGAVLYTALRKSRAKEKSRVKSSHGQKTRQTQEPPLHFQCARSMDRMHSRGRMLMHRCILHGVRSTYSNPFAQRFRVCNDGA
eukprot:1568517-Amphidinium_carterae.1